MRSGMGRAELVELLNLQDRRRAFPKTRRVEKCQFCGESYEFYPGGPHDQHVTRCHSGRGPEIPKERAPADTAGLHWDHCEDRQLADVPAADRLEVEDALRRAWLDDAIRGLKGARGGGAWVEETPADVDAAAVAADDWYRIARAFRMCWFVLAAL